jgi:peptidyl-prolyl cis-trans isomerase A (cyclophilin A)/peptidyl-prolyl cis-trans isomerase B (cyclophilin B)
MRTLLFTLIFMCLSVSSVLAENPKVALTTSKGTIVLELNSEKAPMTVENFLTYVREGFYSGTVFHRVIPNFMIQGGGMDAAMTPKKGHAPIKNEADNGLKNDKYTIAMARTGEIHSATSQFFINSANNDFLNHGVRDFGYAVFGKVVEGTDVVDAIEAVPTGSRGMHRDVPVEPVVIEKAEVVQ